MPGARSGLIIVASGLLLLEISLQLAALVLPALASRSGDPSPGTGAIRILCVGDSHTYGSGVGVAESYPAQLEHMLNQQNPELRFEVLNLGVPGSNSAFVANRLERQILRYRPALVIVWTGINNRWNAAESDSWKTGSWQRLRRVLLHSRLFRLAAAVWSTRSSGRYEPAARKLPSASAMGEHAALAKPRSQNLSEEEARRTLRFDLERIAEVARTSDTPLLFVKYPLPYPGVNAEIAESCRRLGVPIVDTGLAFRRAVDAGHAKQALLKLAVGPHPTGILYGYIAEVMVSQVEEAVSVK